jgi:hypothetical protein
MSKKKEIIIEPTPAQAIAEMQLNILLEKAKERSLTLEEVKIYDMLVKNLQISKGEATGIIEAKFKKLEEERESIPTDVIISKVIEDKSGNNDDNGEKV